eukprot:2255427-Pyramimonas_sp.AAC.1
MDALEIARWFWAALIYHDVSIDNDSSTHYAGESALVIDAKALCDAAKKEHIASFQDKRAGIEALALRERMEAARTQWNGFPPS